MVAVLSLSVKVTLDKTGFLPALDRDAVRFSRWQVGDGSRRYLVVKFEALVLKPAAEEQTGDAQDQDQPKVRPGRSVEALADFPRNGLDSFLALLLLVQKDSIRREPEHLQEMLALPLELTQKPFCPGIRCLDSLTQRSKLIGDKRAVLSGDGDTGNGR